MARGRRRTFDVESAVATALPIFIAKGYEGAAFGDLIAAMGINPPSFYSAFGSKEGLFRRAMELYAARGAPLIADALSLPTANQVIERLLRSTADAHTDPAKPAGCLFVQGALCCSDGARDIRDELAKYRNAFEAQLLERLFQARAAKDLPADADPAALALFISTVCQGMAVQAAGGATRNTLHRLVDVTLRALPKPAAPAKAPPPSPSRRRRSNKPTRRARAAPLR
jgi:AcrR family transcriptional regulator